MSQFFDSHEFYLSLNILFWLLNYYLVLREPKYLRLKNFIVGGTESVVRVLAPKQAEYILVGMGNTPGLGDDAGVLFKWGLLTSSKLRRTMFDTDVVYLDRDFNVLKIIEGRAHERKSLPRYEARYIMVMARGAAIKRGIVEGRKLVEVA